VADSPISHYNSWVRVPTPSTADRGSASYPEALMETGDEFGRPDAVQPRSSTTTNVFDGGGNNIHETPVASAYDNRPITRRAYIIRVDHMKTTAPPLSTTVTPSGVYDSVSEYSTESVMDTGNEREKPGGAQPTYDIQGGIFDGGVCPQTKDRPPEGRTAHLCAPARYVCTI